jgi:hypothetical protein
MLRDPAHHNIYYVIHQLHNYYLLVGVGATEPTGNNSGHSQRFRAFPSLLPPSNYGKIRQKLLLVHYPYFLCRICYAPPPINVLCSHRSNLVVKFVQCADPGFLSPIHPVSGFFPIPDPTTKRGGKK